MKICKIPVILSVFILIGGVDNLRCYRSKSIGGDENKRENYEKVECESEFESCFKRVIHLVDGLKDMIVRACARNCKDGEVQMTGATSDQFCCYSDFCNTSFMKSPTKFLLFGLFTCLLCANVPNNLV